jgi:hypothetical protein
VFSSNNLAALLWWGLYTVAGVWAQRTVPGVDFLAPGIVLSMQEDGGRRTVWLALAWMLLIEGTGNLPFGYGLAWYGLLTTLYLLGRGLFEARSVVFMCLLGAAMGTLHPVLTHSLATLADLTVDTRQLAMEGALQAVSFPLVWLVADKCFPRMLRQDVKPL